MADRPALLKIKDLSSVADYLLVCAGESERQVQAIAANVAEGLKKTKSVPWVSRGWRRGAGYSWITAMLWPISSLVR